MMINKRSFCLMSVKRGVLALLCMSWLSFTAQADEESHRWIRIGPEGADINQLVMSASQPTTLYAATKPGSFYSSSNEYILKSLNGGDSWVTLPWQGKAFSADAIVANRTHQNYSSFFYSPPSQGRSLAVDSKNPDIVFTSLSGFLLKTSDSGMSWRALGVEINLDGTAFFLMNTNIDASLSGLVVPDNNLAHTVDGEHWTLSNTRINVELQQTIEPTPQYPKGESNIHLLSADPENNAILYGYTTLRHRGALAPMPVLLYKSIDKGKSWLNITPAGYRYLGGELVFAPDNGQHVFSIFAKTEEDSFVTTVDAKRLMSSENGGASWQALSSPATDLATYDVTHVYLDPVDKNTLYASISAANVQPPESIKAIAKSVDSGKSWDIIDTSPYFPGSIVIDPKNNKKLLMVSKQGVLSSDNGGQNWNLSNSGMRHIGGKLSIAADNALVMYLAGNDLGSVIDSRDATGFYYKTLDGGLHWDAFMTSPVVTGYCREFKINPVDNQDIFCISDENIYQSLDGGEQWVHIKTSKSRQLVRAQDGVIIYLSDSTGTSRSEDNGKSWHVISSIYEGELSLHPQNQATLYYLLDDQLYVSVEGGIQWLKLETQRNMALKHLLIHPLNPEVMVLYDVYGYQLSVDGGHSWRIVLETFANGNAEINSFPPQFSYISQLVLHPVDSKRIYVKTNTGIYESSDQGVQWKKRISGIESHISNGYIGVNLLTSASDVYVDTSSGIFRLTDKVNYTAVSDCIFNWMEQDNTELFSPASVNSELWNGYLFRYYSQSNTYLGIFHEQEVHQLQPEVSGELITQSSVAAYQELSGCTDTRFKLSASSANN